MLDPSRLADTVMPPSFWPVGDAIAPLRIWSAACALPASPSPAITAAALANSMLRIFVMRLSPVVSLNALSAARRRGGHRYGHDVRNNIVNVGITQRVSPARHLPQTRFNDLVHELRIAVCRRFV